VVKTDAEVGLLHAGVECQRLFERLLDALAIPRRAKPFAAKHSPLGPRAVGAARIEPGLRAPRLAFDPGLSGRDGAIRFRLELGIATRVERIELNLPP